jgi:hypothetical protein
VGGLDEDGERAGPFFHPVHGDAAEERALGAVVEGGGLGMVIDEALGFALVKLVEFAAINGGHRRRRTMFGMRGMGKGRNELAGHPFAGPSGLNITSEWATIRESSCLWTLGRLNEAAGAADAAREVNRDVIARL